MASDHSHLPWVVENHGGRFRIMANIGGKFWHRHEVCRFKAGDSMAKDNANFIVESVSNFPAHVEDVAFPAFVRAPTEPTFEMIEAGLGATGAWLNIPGSQLTVNREKMRLRYQAMLAAFTGAALMRKRVG